MESRIGPTYLSLWRTGELHERAKLAHDVLGRCTICPRACHANRLHDQLGFCCTGLNALVASFHAHFGEESPLVGRGGSGTIFFAGCNLGCLFCQNYDISHGAAGRPVDAEELAAMMLHLQVIGCHNINLVSPTHVVPQILAALAPAVEAGLRLPLVYNTGGYDSLATLRLLDGVVDIYMPDMKYADAAVAQRLSGVSDYPTRNREAVREMHRQVGDLQVDERGVARRGLLVRHLVLPDGLAGTGETVRFLAQEISPGTYLNLMDQYRPCYRAGELSGMNRRIWANEYQQALALARCAGLNRLDDRA